MQTGGFGRLLDFYKIKQEDASETVLYSQFYIHSSSLTRFTGPHESCANIPSTSLVADGLVASPPPTGKPVRRVPVRLSSLGCGSG